MKGHVWLTTTMLILYHSCCSNPQSSAQSVEDHMIDMIEALIDMANNSTIKLEGITAKLNSVEEQLSVCQDQVAVLQNTSETEFQKMSSAIESCAEKEQVHYFEDLLTKDECADGHDNCSILATCSDNLLHYSCTCLPGYTGDGFTCGDIDECSSNPCGDKEVCVNTFGSYTCNCGNGFEMIENVCQDIDECARGIDGCHRRAQCYNNEGSYTCECKQPFSGNGYTCQTVECESPSLFLEDYGCIVITEEELTWPEANETCHKRGFRLLENVKKRDFEQIRDHFTPLLANPYRLWIGFKARRWLTSRIPVAVETLAVNEGTLDAGCGLFDMKSGDSFGLFDHPCNDFKFYAFCQARVL